MAPSERGLSSECETEGVGGADDYETRSLCRLLPPPSVVPLPQGGRHGLPS
jgi:hypothetical protein